MPTAENSERNTDDFLLEKGLSSLLEMPSTVINFAEHRHNMDMNTEQHRQMNNAP